MTSVFYPYFDFKFEFNKNGRFIVRYQDKVMSREQLVSACQSLLGDLECAVTRSNSEKGTKYSLSRLVPSGFSYLELKAFLTVLLRDWFFIHKDTFSDVFYDFEALLLNLVSERRRYMGHIPQSFLDSNDKLNKTVHVVKVVDSFDDSVLEEKFVCILAGVPCYGHSESDLLRNLKIKFPNFSKKYNLILKVRE